MGSERREASLSVSDDHNGARVLDKAMATKTAWDQGLPGSLSLEPIDIHRQQESELNEALHKSVVGNLREKKAELPDSRSES